MLRKFSEKQKIKQIQEFESIPKPLNESEETYEELKGKYWDLAETVAEMFNSNQRGISYSAEDVIQVAEIAKTWECSIADMIQQQFQNGLAESWEHITLGTIEYQIYDNAWGEVAFELDLEEKYGQDTGYYSDEYGIWEEGQWVEYNTDIDSDGRLEFNVITNPVEGDKTRVYDKEELAEALEERIMWEYSNYEKHENWEEEDESE